MKKFLIILSVIILLLVIGFVYLYYDSPYDNYNDSELIETKSINIKKINRQKITTNDSINKNIIVNGKWFASPDGRTMFIRGINLGGSSKVPFKPYLPTYKKEGFYDGKNISFVGRPFPLEEADEHFQRLKKWGFHFFRFIVTWEAIEHEGPGIYDEEYIEYIYQLLKKANEYELNVFIDPHQDVYSRFTGGDGAPMWTFEKVGMDVSKFPQTFAALLHNTNPIENRPMSWPNNAYLYGCATMFTLFFAGNDFAPQLKIDGEPVQDYLQSHYINAIRHLAEKIGNLPNVIGFDTMNEPNNGYLGMKDLSIVPEKVTGEICSPAEGMFLTSGFPQEIKVIEMKLTGMSVKEKRLFNKEKISIWKEGKECIWKENGVWDIDTSGNPILLKPDYFYVKESGKKVDFVNDYFKPFAKKYSEMVWEINSNLLVFMESSVFPIRYGIGDWKGENSDKIIYAPHWYELVNLFFKRYIPWVTFHSENLEPTFGKKNVRKLIEKQLLDVQKLSEKYLGQQPSLVGEVGIAFDLNNKKSFENGDFSDQIKAADRNMLALENTLSNYTWWNYTADNNNKWGDQWNGEGLSIFSRDQQKDKNDINSGGRALESIVRPYPYKVAGEIKRFWFNYKDKEFVLEFIPNQNSNLPTEIFIPEFHYKNGFKVLTNGGKFEFDNKNDLLLFYPDEKNQLQTLIVRTN